MDFLSEEEKLGSIKSIQSTINKLENALAKMTQEGSNTTLAMKRLKAHRIGLAMLENYWSQRPHNYTTEEISEAYTALNGLFPSLETSYAKSKLGSPQRTLLERRIQALKFAVQAMDKL